MTSSSMLLSLVLLVASSSAWGVARAHGDGLEHIRVYLHEIYSGPNATVFDVLPPLNGGNTTFGIVRMFDNELRSGPNPSNSSLLGRFQGFIAFAGVAGSPGKQSVVSFVFTAGEHSGSTLDIMGIVQSIDGAIQRAVVGGTGMFKMARGYSNVTIVWNPTPVSTMYEVNLFLKMDG